jgi:hypothetical protein
MPTYSSLAEQCLCLSEHAVVLTAPISRAPLRRHMYSRRPPPWLSHIPRAVVSLGPPWPGHHGLGNRRPMAPGNVPYTSSRGCNAGSADLIGLSLGSCANGDDWLLGTPSYTLDKGQVQR